MNGRNKTEKSYIQSTSSKITSPTNPFWNGKEGRKYRKFVHMVYELVPLGVRVIHLLILCSLFTLCFVLIPTAIFSRLEPSWNSLDAFYYVFISLTTIGLGDYIPGDGNGQQLKDLYKGSVAGTLI